MTTKTIRNDMVFRALKALSVERRFMLVLDLLDGEKAYVHKIDASDVKILKEGGLVIQEGDPYGPGTAYLTPTPYAKRLIDAIFVAEGIE